MLGRLSWLDTVCIDYHVKRNYERWWQKYAYVFSSSLSCGIGIAGLVIFFAVQFHAVDINWWGQYRVV
ncbi:hypothetical protein N7471_005508 [Penicillium samsonianum]|uniref:uncharacterized protein n=1 Tax=Penicillium samsonianum TaxID=1882272 RepID=UPI002546EADB|nr:uncharacterized protein N7471_005508 [Penicillium samsonianum]KAJ6139022.1 hypothetical protein N7471_005508 [Penicillium samsonianum]